jgi:hypothetical protein
MGSTIIVNVVVEPIAYSKNIADCCDIFKYPLVAGQDIYILVHPECFTKQKASIIKYMAFCVCVCGGGSMSQRIR